jgi:serine protease AprX
MRGFKLAPSLAGAPEGRQANTLAEVAARPIELRSKKPRTVDVVFHKDVDPSAIREKIAAAARLDPADLKLGRRKARLRVQEQYLPDLAALDEVRHVEEAPVYKLHNNVARRILGLPTPATAGTPAFQGDGQVVAVADTGLDKGSTTDVHPAFTGRVLKLYALGRPNKANDPDGHGTHVAGSVLGDGVSATLGLQIQGTAPKAKLVLQSVLDSGGGLGGLPDDLHDLFSPPYDSDGARVHSNSWGDVRGDGSYNANSAELDDFVFTHRDCVICFAAGNEGVDANADGHIDAGSITPPATAKNCITVGATENDRPTFDLTYGDGWPNDFPADPIASDRVADDPDGMVAFSSRGPVKGRRSKPDVVAPGTSILSTRSRATTSKGWGLSDDPLYFFEGGTSMATPLVAGCAALVRELLIKQHQLSSPSAALVKAVLINGAENIKGQYVPTEAGRIPNRSEGFGRVSMAAIFGSAANQGLTLKDEGTELDTGQDEQLSVQVGPHQSLLKVTLVWTDPPGETLQNDLDLLVQGADGKVRHGNVAATSTKFDRANNVEQVIWTRPPAGTATITVRAHRVAAEVQSYALVVRLA